MNIFYKGVLLSCTLLCFDASAMKVSVKKKTGCCESSYKGLVNVCSRLFSVLSFESDKNLKIDSSSKSGAYSKSGPSSKPGVGERPDFTGIRFENIPNFPILTRHWRMIQEANRGSYDSLNTMGLLLHDRVFLLAVQNNNTKIAERLLESHDFSWFIMALALALANKVKNVEMKNAIAIAHRENTNYTYNAHTNDNYNYN